MGREIIESHSAIREPSYDIFLVHWLFFMEVEPVIGKETTRQETTSTKTEIIPNRTVGNSSR